MYQQSFSLFLDLNRKPLLDKLVLALHIKKGFQEHGPLTKNFMINTQRDQGSNQDFSTSIGSNLNLIALPALFAAGTGIAFLAGRLALPAFFNKISNPLIGSTISAVGITTLLAAPSASWNYKTYEGSGKRKND